jgi:uncharacterized protein (DUF1697 family)
MGTYISILRGINITGHRIIKMEALRAMYLEMGFGGVQSYIQSGNVIFRCNAAPPAELASRLTNKIKERFGFDVPVIVLETGELREIIASNPFLADSSKDLAKIYLTFLSALPDPARYDAIGEGLQLEESWHLTGKTIYIYCPGGYGTTKLSTNFLESKLKVTATSRNWNTTLRLLQLAEKLPDEGTG